MLPLFQPCQFRAPCLICSSLLHYNTQPILIFNTTLQNLSVLNLGSQREGNRGRCSWWAQDCDSVRCILTNHDLQIDLNAK